MGEGWPPGSAILPTLGFVEQLGQKHWPPRPPAGVRSDKHQCILPHDPCRSVQARFKVTMKKISLGIWFQRIRVFFAPKREMPNSCHGTSMPARAQMDRLQKRLSMQRYDEICGESALQQFVRYPRHSASLLSDPRTAACDPTRTSRAHTLRNPVGC
jgi:hypothetical protein